MWVTVTFCLISLRLTAHHQWITWLLQTSSDCGPQCPYSCALTKAPFCRVCISSQWQWKAGDTVTSNEEWTSHPIGYPVYLESRPLEQKQQRMSWGIQKMCVSQQRHRWSAAVLLSAHPHSNYRHSPFSWSTVRPCVLQINFIYNQGRTVGLAFMLWAATSLEQTSVSMILNEPYTANSKLRI